MESGKNKKKKKRKEKQKKSSAIVRLKMVTLKQEEMHSSITATAIKVDAVQAGGAVEFGDDAK